MDIATDVLVLSFPIAILWRVRISARQKLGLGISLCLSAAMVIVAIIRIAGMSLADGTVDIIWLAFWQQQECSIAVLMVSMSAFRSFFVAGAASHRSPQRLAHSSPSWKRRVFRNRLFAGEHDLEATNGLPPIPNATLTGMRTWIRDVRHSKFRPDESKLQGTTQSSSSTEV